MSEEPVTHLVTDNLSDFHCHCDYSMDAIGSIEDYCAAALERGLAELCFTTHFDTNPNSAENYGFIRISGELKPATTDNLAKYVDHVHQAQEQFYPLGLSVKLGVEFGWYPGCEETARKLKERYDFDYFLGGIHEIENISFCVQSEYEKCLTRLSVEKMAEKYFQSALQFAKCGLFTAMAHLDSYRIYGEKFYGPSVMTAHRPYINDLFQALKSTNTAIEINTAGLRCGLAHYFPQMEIVNAATRAGVEIAHLGSDAHAPEQVGYDFDAAASLIPHAIGGCED